MGTSLPPNLEDTPGSKGVTGVLLHFAALANGACSPDELRLEATAVIVDSASGPGVPQGLCSNSDRWGTLLQGTGLLESGFPLEVDIPMAAISCDRETTGLLAPDLETGLGTRTLVHPKVL